MSLVTPTASGTSGFTSTAPTSIPHPPVHLLPPGAKRYYLAGPMAGVKDNNLEAFMLFTRELRARHHDIVAPHEIDPGVPDPEWEDYLRADLMYGLLHCNAMILMPGWRASRGVALELEVARKLDYHIYHVNDRYQLRLSKMGNQDDTR